MSGGHRIRLTSAWDPPDPHRASWRRSFGRPGGLAAGDQVWLVIESPTDGPVTVNGVPLRSAAPTASAWRADVTALLRDRNELIVDLGAGERLADAGSARRPLPGGLGDVYLEIVSVS